MSEHKSTVDINFLESMNDKMKYMTPIRQASEHIQKHGMPLCKTQGALDSLSKRIRKQRGVPGERTVFQ